MLSEYLPNLNVCMSKFKLNHRNYPESENVSELQTQGRKDLSLSIVAKGIQVIKGLGVDVKVNFHVSHINYSNEIHMAGTLCQF